ncbi:MAG: helix-turn-helix transcriptional regulator [Clostridiales bacterium]|nr:helix-turn-helix transcriptional regulator [Clostridiales bacterium]
MSTSFKLNSFISSFKSPISWMRKIHKKTFVQFFGTYLILVLVMASPLWSLYSATLSSVKESIVKESFSAVQKGCALLEKEILNQHSTAIFLRRNDDFIKIARAQENIPPDQISGVLRAKKLFINTGFPSDLIFGSYFAFKYNNLVISRSKIFTDMHNLNKNYLQTPSLSYDEWLSMLFGNKEQISFRESLVVYHREAISMPFVEAEVIPLIISLPLENYTVSDSAMLVLFDAKALVKALAAEAILEGGFLYIVRDSGDVLYRYNINEDLNPSEISTGISQLTRGGENTTFLKTSDSQLGLSVIAGIPISVYTDRISEVTRSLLITVFGFLLLGLLLALFFSFRQTRPISELIRTVNDLHSPFEKTSNTFDYIRDSIVQLDLNGKQHEKQLRSLREGIKISLTEKILSGRLCDGNDIESFLRYNQMTEPFFIVACMTAQDDSATQVEERALMSMALDEALQKRMQGRSYATHHIGTEICALILNLTEEEARDEMRIRSEFLLLRSELQSSAGIDVRFGSSLACANLDHIPRCFSQAKEAASAADNTGFAIFSGSTEIRATSTFDLASAQQLNDLILLADAERVEALFEKLSCRMSNMGGISGQEKSQIIFAIRNAICCSAAALKSDLAIPAYNDADSISASLIKMKQAALDLAACQKTIQEKKISKFKDSMVEYVNQSFKDPLLCAASVADAFSVSEKYVFNLFRAQTSKSFGEYLEGIRLKEAENLLENSSIVISSIYQQVGFNSSNTFYKAFKRVYNTSPGVWRSARAISAENPQ